MGGVDRHNPASVEMSTRSDDSKLGGSPRFNSAELEQWARRTVHTPVLLRQHIEQWRWKTSRRRFMFYEAGIVTQPQEDEYEVRFMVGSIGKVRCGLEELVALFLTTSEAEHNRMMTGLHRHRYIHGSLLHQALFSADGISTSMLSIKTGAFCKTNWRGKNERWCYVELLEVHEATDRVILTMDSLPEEIGAGLDATKYARPLTNVRMVCVLDKAEDLAPGKGLVDVACYAEFRAVSKDSAVEVTKSMKRRLLALCKMSSNIQHVVRQRRFAIQAPMYARTLTPSSTFCACCTKPLGLFSRHARCHSCGYYACHACITSLGRTQVTKSRPTCISCQTSEPLHLTSAHQMITPRKPRTVSAPQPAVEQSSVTASALADVLQTTLIDTSLQKREAAVQVAKLLIEGTSSTNHRRNHRLALTAVETSLPRHGLLKRQLRSTLPVDELQFICSLASKELRCSTSAIVVLDNRQVLQVVASNRTTLKGKPFPFPIPNPSLSWRWTAPRVSFDTLHGDQMMDGTFCCSCPLETSPEAQKEIIGYLVCISKHSRTLTKAQEESLLKLTRLAAKMCHW